MDQTQDSTPLGVDRTFQIVEPSTPRLPPRETGTPDVAPQLAVSPMTFERSGASFVRMNDSAGAQVTFPFGQDMNAATAAFLLARDFSVRLESNPDRLELVVAANQGSIPADRTHAAPTINAYDAATNTVRFNGTEARILASGGDGRSLASALAIGMLAPARVTLEEVRGTSTITFAYALS